MKRVILAFVLLLLSSAAFSEEQTVVQLGKKVEQLENRVAILESLIADQSRSKSETSNVVPADKKAWRKLKKGMKMDDVRKLLGEPLTINSGGFTRWYYSESVAHSSVVFDDRDAVRGWSEPE